MSAALPFVRPSALALLAALVPSALGAGLCPPFDAQCCHIAPGRDPAYADCRNDPARQVPGWEEVDLDAPPAERWAHLVRPKAAEMRTMLAHFKNFLGAASRDLFELVELLPTIQRLASNVLDSLGEYGLEMRGIANATGLPEEEVLLYNIMYEVEGGCTSIVAQDAEGHVLHGRNLDFGLFFGEDFKHLQWIITEDLRPLLMRVRFTKGGRVVFNSTAFLGYVGLVSGAKRGSFSLTLNSRFDSERWAELLAYLKGTRRTGRFATQLLRDVIQQNETYEEALATIQSARLLGPAYIILGGVSPNQGAVVARTATGLVQQRLLGDAARNGSNFLVQTNWDVPRDPWYDNRRSPAEHCLQDRFNTAIGFEGLFQVLSAHPNRNRLTTYTALMSAQTGEVESYLQFCTELNCAPWLAAGHAIAV